MAAEVIVSESMTDPRRFFATSLRGGMNLLDAMLSHGAQHIIFSSSAAVYGEPSEIPIGKDTLTRPINSYGESKLMFERILEWYHRAYGLRYISLRYFNAAGASEKFGNSAPPDLRSCFPQPGSGESGRAVSKIDQLGCDFLIS